MEARGLMRDRAVLVINGQQRFLRVGETSPEGVMLVAADPRQARIRVGGEEIELGLSQRIGARFVEPELREVQVVRDTEGHFRVAGTIEGRPVQFMVDTGATILAMSSDHADSLGIDYRRSGEIGQVMTASGAAVSHFLTLQAVQVGGITVNGVAAAVVEGPYPTDILLGMSFLRHVGLTERAGVLTIQQQF